MAEFDSLAEQLFKLLDKIDFGGWIVICKPSLIDGLQIRVEWFLPNKKKYSFEMLIRSDEVLGNISIMDLFVDKANKAINDFLNHR